MYYLPTARKYVLLWLMVSLLCISAKYGNAQTLSPRSFTISFNEALTIGGNTSEEAGYFLTSPYQIRTDSDQNIYVAEGQQKTIMMFSAKGKYLRSIGRKGNGPGEFPSGPQFILNNDNEIVALDLESKRMTWFSKQGDILQEHAPSEAGMVWSRKFEQTADGNYIVLKKPRDIGDDTPDGYRTNVLHLYDESFEHNMGSYGNFEDMLPEAGSKFVKMISNRMNGGHFVRIGDRKLWYVPGIYYGRIHEFSKKDRAWRQTDTFSGRISAEQAVELNTEGPGSMAIVTYNSEGQERSRGKINSYSIGLLQMSDGRVLHFSGQRMQDQDSLQTVVEVFSPQGKLLGTGAFDEIAIDRNLGYFSSHTPAIWMDENDRFYFIDHREIPVVRVGRIVGL